MSVQLGTNCSAHRVYRLQRRVPSHTLDLRLHSKEKKKAKLVFTATKFKKSLTTKKKCYMLKWCSKATLWEKRIPSCAVLFTTQPHHRSDMKHHSIVTDPTGLKWSTSLLFSSSPSAANTRWQQVQTELLKKHHPTTLKPTSLLKQDCLEAH